MKCFWKLQFPTLKNVVRVKILLNGIFWYTGTSKTLIYLFIIYLLVENYVLHSNFKKVKKIQNRNSVFNYFLVGSYSTN